MVRQFIPGQSEQPKEIQTPILKVRGKTLIFANSIYQISSISALDLLDLSTEKPMPNYFSYMLVIGLILIFLPDNFKILGVVTLSVLGYLCYQWYSNKRRTRYGLRIRMNGGFGTIIVYSEMAFLVKIMLILNNIMNTDEIQSINFNLDQRQIVEDKSVNVGSMTGSSVITGNVHGDVVNNV